MTKPRKREIAWLGWRPDTPDYRDYRFDKAKVARVKRLPQTFDLSNQLPPIQDQGNLGSCVSHAVAAALRFDRMTEKKADYPISRLMIYYGARWIEGTVQEDAGCEIRDAIKVVASSGASREELWPYQISKFAEKPPAKAYRQALATQALEYLRVEQTEAAIKAALCSGFPVVFGFMCYEAIMSDAVAKSGNLPMPKRGEKAVGGHAVALVGWDATGRFLVRNSWGTGWGKAGYFTMPVAYVTSNNLADDFWVIRRVG